MVAVLQRKAVKAIETRTLNPRITEGTPFPESPLKTLVWAVLQQARADAVRLGENDNLRYTNQVTNEAILAERDELLEWVWCERFRLWMGSFDWTDREIDDVSQRLTDVSGKNG